MPEELGAGTRMLPGIHADTRTPGGQVDGLPTNYRQVDSSTPGTQADRLPAHYRQVVSFRPRGGRLNHVQHRAFADHAARWLLQPEGGLDPDVAFGRSAPLVVEIGPGMGESTARMAAARPDVNLLAIEVYKPGIAQTFHHAAKAGVSNVRVMRGDAVAVLHDVLAPAAAAELWVFFPDPWPKRRHHKRRLVTRPFADLAASRLAPGGVLRLATDWAEYAQQMLAACTGAAGLANSHDGFAPRPDFRPVTRFERRGITENRVIFDLEFRRV